MTKALKTFTTSAGFFDLAVSAPSMKAALQAWGASRNLFTQGFAKVSTDPKVVAATMAKPGVVLRRPVGSQGAYGEDADLPTSLPAKAKARPTRRTVETSSHRTRPRPSPEERPARKTADTAKAERLAAQAFEREQKRREREQRKEDQARQRERERREHAVAAAQAALDKATRDHETRVGDIEKERAAVDRRLDEETTRWRQKKERLDKALRDVRTVSYLKPV